MTIATTSPADAIMGYLFSKLSVGVDDEQAALDVGHDDIGPDGDAGVGVERDGEPLLAPGPDPPRVVRALDLLGHQGGIPDHPLDAVEH